MSGTFRSAFWCGVIVVAILVATIWGRPIESESYLFDDVTQQAEKMLRQRFSEGSLSRFAIWPSEYALKQGYELRLSAGVSNNLTEDRRFVINVLPLPTSTASDEVMRGWIHFDATAGTIRSGNTGFKFIAIKPTLPGQHRFLIVACSSKTPITAGNCGPSSPDLWGSPQTLSVTVG